MQFQAKGRGHRGDQQVPVGGLEIDRREVGANGEEEGKDNPTEAEELKKLEELGTKGMYIRLVLLTRSVGTAKNHSQRCLIVP